jgi:hypothetical protein
MRATWQGENRVLLKSLPFSRRARKQKSKSVRKTVLKRANVKLFPSHSLRTATTDAQSQRSGQHTGGWKHNARKIIAHSLSALLLVQPKTRVRETYDDIYWSAVFASSTLR